MPHFKDLIRPKKDENNYNLNAAELRVFIEVIVYIRVYVAPDIT
jgi:hypothetical protein